VPFDQLPSVTNPAEGMIVTANQAVTGPGAGYDLTPDPDHGYRSQRIRTLVQQRLQDGGRLDVADMARIQLDDRSPVAPVLVPYLLRQLTTSEYYADGQRLLSRWNYDQSAGSAAAAYFNVVWSNLLRLTFHDQLPESLWPDGGQRWLAVVANLLRQPDSQWWDDATTDGVIEDRDMIIAQAMRDARDELTNRLSVHPNGWSWGRLHHLDLDSQVFGQSGVGLVRWIFNRGPFQVGGGDAIVDATSWDATKGYDVTSAPSMRMVVDLDDLDRSRWINLTGASGHAASPHYRDQTPLWVRGDTLPWPSTPSAVRKAADDTLRLRPTK
jgi:penicillin amidase